MLPEWKYCGVALIFLGCGVCIAQPKTLAPGVLKVIPTQIDARDTFSLPMPLLGLEAEAYSPNYLSLLNTLHGQSKNVIFFRDVWQYEFGFLGLRQIELRLPDTATPSGVENVWYLVYRIRNTGQNMYYQTIQEDQRFEHLKYELKTNKPDFEIDSKFLPHFYLHGWIKPYEEDYREVRYRDQVDPEALRQIRLAEDKNRFFLDKVEMMFAKFPMASSADDDGIWGVAIWRNVDPRIDFVSVTVSGLTNAYRIDTLADGTRAFRYRHLQLNFWRPGDVVRQHEDRITYGIPLVDDPVRQVEICQRYRLPGPLIRGYVVSQVADQNVLVAELDAQIQFSTFQSALTPDLDQGKLPNEIRKAFADSGIEIPEKPAIEVLIPQQKWGLAGSIEGEPHSLILMVEPQYWEPEGERIRFINSLDYLWVYR